MENIFMKCGHIAYSFDNNGRPYCIMCDCYDIADNIPDLTERKAVCSDCGKIVDSNFNLPFFEYRKNRDTDSFYCGCMGWD